MNVSENRNSLKQRVSISETETLLVKFSDVQKAQKWLCEQHRVVVWHISAKHCDSSDEITIQFIRYPFETNYKYSLETCTLKGTDNIRLIWEKENPLKRCIKCLRLRDKGEEKYLILSARK